jgi:AraC-like DNA-binding protein
LADPLSTVLESLRLKGAAFVSARFTAPFAVDTRVKPEQWRTLLTDPSEMIAYHFVLEGRLLVSVEGQPPLEVSAGSIVILPNNPPHRLASGADVIPVQSQDIIQMGPLGGLPRVEYGGGGEPVRIFCGFLGCEDRRHPLIAALPALLSVGVEESASRALIESSLSFAVRELAQDRPAAASMLGKVSEMLLFEAIRRYVETAEPQGGWLKGLRDPQVGRALALIHADITRAWAAEDLAHEVSLSRTAFVQRFSDLVGAPPFRYLTAWRMETAKRQLRETVKSVAQVGFAVGYESEEAFNRAFRREVGLPPATWRDRQEAAASA